MTGTPERLELEKTLTKLRSQLPLKSEIFYNGQSQKIAKNEDQVLPAEHATKFTNYPLASKEQITTAIESALKAKQSWQDTPFVDRAAIFMKAAELVTGKYRYELIAATMLGQGKNMWQGEIDAAAELADFWRLNCNFAAEILERQPTRGANGMWRYVSHTQDLNLSSANILAVAWTTVPWRASSTLSPPSTSPRSAALSCRARH